MRCIQMQIPAVRPYPKRTHIMVVLATVSHKCSCPLACGYVKCSGVYIIVSRIAHAAKTSIVPCRADENITADRVVDNLLVLIPAPSAVIVNQHHIARDYVAWIAD